MIELVTTENLDHVIKMMVQMKDESPVYREYPVSISHTTDMLKMLMTAGAFIGVIDSEHRGCMFGTCTWQWFSPVYEANEMALFVYPGHRGKSVSVRLIDAFEREAAARSATAVNVGVSTGISDERTEQLYMALGYHRHGLGLRKVIHV